MVSSFLNRSMNEATALPRKRRARVTPFAVIILLVAFVLGSNLGYGQDLEYEYSKASKDGFELTKVVSDTEVQSGQVFTYNISFSIPPGATNVTIVDHLSNSLEFVGSSYNVGLTCQPINQTPTFMTGTESSIPLYTRGATYSLSNFLSTPAQCYIFGSIIIEVRFPPGVTCNGTEANNQVCISYTLNGKKGEFCTNLDSVKTTAIASNPWNVKKWISNAANQGGDCPNAVIDTVVEYKIQVYKTPGTTGQLNLVGGILTDEIPTGAILQSSSCGAVQNGTTITWNVGNLSALPDQNSVLCTFNILFPRDLFPVGEQIKNVANLDGTLGDSIIPNCGKVHVNSDTVCFEIKEYRNGNIGKFAYTNGQPGCSGYYTIQICNRGNVPLKDIILRDTLPSALNYNSTIVTSPSPWTTTFNNGIITMDGGAQTLAVGACITITVNFTIPVNTSPDTVIKNCAYLYSNADSIAKVICNSFTVIAAQPKACVNKQVCPDNKSCYSPGDTLTYRLRVQNIGGKELDGATITDVLDPNLEYIGEVRSYVNSNHLISCGQTTDQWGSNLIIRPPSSGSNTVQFELANIPFNCDAVGGCGANSTNVPFYFIEFKVKVRDSSALGTIYNKFTISGGGLISPETSKEFSICVNATPYYLIEKTVRESGSGTFGSTAIITPGGSVDYRLSIGIPAHTPQFAALRHVSFIDELPLNVSSTVDQELLRCSNRGSLFGLTFTGSFSSSTNPSATPVGCNITNSGYPKISSWGISWTGTPPNIFGSGCSTMNASTWTPTTSITANTKNNGFYFNQWAFVPSTTIYPWVEFTAKADSAGVNDSIACNSFAASAAVRRIINGRRYQDYPIAAIQSDAVCIIMNNVACDGDEIGKPVIDNSCCSAYIPITNLSESDITEIRYSINGGQIKHFDILGSCSTFTTSPTPVYGSSSGTITFNPACTASSFNLGVEILATQTPSILYLEIVHANGTICKDSVLFNCKPAPQLKCDKITIVNGNWSGQPTTDHSTRMIKIENQIFPPSDICSIEISTSTIPNPSGNTDQWGGGNILINSTVPSIPWAIDLQTLTGQDEAPYIRFSKIRFQNGYQGLQPGGINTVEFTISLPYYFNWTGYLTIKVIHCDGRECKHTVPWCAKPIASCPIIIPINDRPGRIDYSTNILSGGGFEVFGSDKVNIRYASVIIDNPEEARFLAVSSENLMEKYKSDSDYDGPIILSSRMTSAGGFVELSGLRNSKDMIPLNYLIQKMDSTNKEPVDMTLILYNQDGEPVSISNFTTNTPASAIDIGDGNEGSVRPYMLKPHPNPTSVDVNLGYWLPANEKATMKIYNSIGDKVLTVDNISSNQGLNSVNISTSSFITGTYLVKLITPSGVASTTFIVVR